MQNFNFKARTEIMFGKGQIEHLPEVLNRYGKNVLLVYGGGSIKRNGIYDKAMELLEGFNVIELSGVEPNPKIESVRKGVELCKQNKIDVVLAIGGGSTIDCSKVVAAGNYYDGDPWDLVTDSRLIQKVLPIVTVLTIAATGSEMNKNAVISNMSLNEKLGTSSREFIPEVSICGPEYTFAVSRYQTASGSADIMSHVMENYFKSEKGTFVQDRLAEGLLQTCIKYTPMALENPCCYEARANLMWASTMALNGLVGAGKPGSWSCHPIEHELSAFYDITHGVGLAIITPKWLRHILNDKTVKRIAMFAKNVWNIDENDEFEAAKKGIDALEEFFNNCGIPRKLSDLGIDKTHISEMARKAVFNGGLIYAYVPLNEKDVEEILTNCL